MRTIRFEFADIPEDQARFFKPCFEQWLVDPTAYTEICGLPFAGVWFVMAVKEGDRDALPLAAARTYALGIEIARRLTSTLHDATGTKARGVGPLDGFEVGFP